MHFRIESQVSTNPLITCSRTLPAEAPASPPELIWANFQKNHDRRKLKIADASRNSSLPWETCDKGPVWAPPTKAKGFVILRK